MSHKVVTLVCSRVIGSSVQKAVLINMADKASDGGEGVFASKSTIAAETEMGLSTVKRAIKDLVDRGLIRETGQRACMHGHTVIYDLDVRQISMLPGWKEDDSTPSRADPVQSEPRPERTATRSRAGRHPVQSGPQTILEPSLNQKQERASAENDGFEDFMDELREALGIALSEAAPAWWQGEVAQQHVRGWIDGLGLSRAQVLAVAARSRQRHAEPPDGPKGLDRAMQRAAAAPAPSRTGRRSAAPAASAAEQLAFLADWVNGDRYLPPNAVTTAQANALVASGLVVAERLRQRGVR